MGLVLDTCVFIEAERKKSQIDFTAWTDYGVAYISAVTASELLLGVHCADNKARQIRRAAFVENILTHIPILDFTLEVARTHAEIHSYLAKAGKLIGAHDLIIAATAIANDCALITQNQREFSRVPGLKILSV